MQKVNTASLEQLFTGARLSGANGRLKNSSGTSDDFQSVMSGTSANSQKVEAVNRTENTNPANQNVSKPMSDKEQSVNPMEQPAGRDAASEKGSVQTMAQEGTAELSKEVQEAVQDVLNIDEETMQSVMAEMGITVVQLLDPAVLQQFVMEVNGSVEVTEFLTSGDMMDQFSELLQFMQELTGVDREELPGLAEYLMQDMQEISQTESAELPVETTLTDAVADITVTQEDVPADVEQNVLSDAPEVEDRPVAQGQPETEAAQDQTAMRQDESRQPVLDETVRRSEVVLQKETVSGDEPSKEQSFDAADLLAEGRTVQETADDLSGQGESSGNQQMQSQTQSEPEMGSVISRRDTDDSQPFTMSQFVENMMQAVSEEQGTESVHPTQMLQIVNQVVEQIRTHMQDGETTMELQLNPESLGKVLLSVTNKDGVMTANFTVQTTEAKEALESQMQVLRENLEQKNLKVDAVEVSVSDFSFSQSGMADDQKNFQQGNGKAARFRYDEEEDEDEAETEAERLRESVMNDSGSSVDFIA